MRSSWFSVVMRRTVRSSCRRHPSFRHFALNASNAARAMSCRFCSHSRIFLHVHSILMRSCSLRCLRMAMNDSMGMMSIAYWLQLQYTLLLRRIRCYQFDCLDCGTELAAGVFRAWGSSRDFWKFECNGVSLLVNAEWYAMSVCSSGTTL